MEKKNNQSFVVGFLAGILVIGGIFFFSKNGETVTEPKTKNYDNQKKETFIASVMKSSESDERYLFDRTLFDKEEITMTIDSFNKSGESSKTYTLWMTLTSNVFPDIDNGGTTSEEYMISSDNIKIVTDTGTTLTGGELSTGTGDGYHISIASREWEASEGSDALATSYTFEGEEEVNEVQVFLVDDNGREMIVSDGIELLNTSANVFTSPEIFSSFLFSEGANELGQYLFQTVADESSSDSQFQYIINYNTYTEDGMAPPGESYGLSKDGKIYTFSIKGDEGRQWVYSEEWTNKIANFDPETWLWEKGVKEKVVASLIEKGYIEEDNYYFDPNESGYSVMIIDEEYGYNPIYVVNVNPKTGDYHA